MSEQKKAIVIIPLANFSSDAELISLETGLRLRSTNPKELSELTNLILYQDSRILDAIVDTEFVIVKELEGINEYAEWVEDSKNITDIILALRLLKKGMIYPQTSFVISHDKKSRLLTNSNPIAPAIEEQYSLEKEEISEFLDVWKKIKLVDTEKPHLLFAMHQFSEVFGDSSDFLVKYMMAFESLVFGRTKDAKQPYSQTISIAISMFIGKNEKERIRIQSDITQAYNYRNKLVHGHLKLKNGSKTQLRKLYARIEEYLRLTLRKFLDF